MTPATAKTTTALRIVYREEVPAGAWGLLRTRMAELQADGRFTKVAYRRVMSRRAVLLILGYAPVEVATQRRGTCQLCGGRYSVETGRVALHGYKRPRWGYVVGRCPGSDEVPAELSIALAQARLEGLEATLPGLRVRLEERGFTFRPNGDYCYPEAYYDYSRRGREAERQLDRDLLGLYTGNREHQVQLREVVLPRFGLPFDEVAR